MPLYRVNNAGRFGLIAPNDRRPYDIPPESWDAMLNCRIINDSVQVVEGITQNVNITNLTVQALDYYNSPTGDQHQYVYCDDDILSVDDGGAVLSVKKAGLVTTAYPNQIWITDQLNGIPISTNNVDAPQCFYNSGGTVLPSTLSQDFPNLPSPAPRARIVVAYKNFIVMLNIVDVNAYPNMVWWSSRAADGLMPDSWDYTDPTNESRRRTLGGNSGAIVAAKVLRDDLFIYTEYACYRMTEIGGTLVMRITKVFDKIGAFGPRTVENYGDKHIVITKSDIVTHDGNQWNSIAEDRVRRRVFEQIDKGDVNRIWASLYLDRSEVHIGIPEPITKEINYALVWQWEDEAKPWSQRSYPDARYMRELPVLETSTVDDSWDGGSDTTWDDGPDIIWNAGGALGDLQPMCTSTDGYLYFVDISQEPIEGQIERTDINLGGDQRLETAQAVYPRIQSDNPVTITIGSSKTVEGSVTWGQSATFDPLTDYHITRFATGRRHAIRIRGQGFRVQGYDIEFVDAGET